MKAQREVPKKALKYKIMNNIPSMRKKKSSESPIIMKS